jgi:hypothetical protein
MNLESEEVDSGSGGMNVRARGGGFRIRGD